jgi:hypothetical protein
MKTLLKITINIIAHYSPFAAVILIGCISFPVQPIWQVTIGCLLFLAYPSYSWKSPFAIFRSPPFPKYFVEYEGHDNEHNTIRGGVPVVTLKEAGDWLQAKGRYYTLTKITIKNRKGKIIREVHYEKV